MAQNVEAMVADRVTADQMAYDEALEELHMLRRHADAMGTQEAQRELRSQERKVETLRRRTVHDMTVDWGFEPRF